MPYVGRDLQRGNYLKLDDISSSFNGSLTTFNLTSGGNAFFPGSAFSIIVSLGGVVQEPESAFQIDRSQIIFATAPTSSSDFFCIALGVALGVGVPGHNTVNNDHLAKPLSYGDYFRWDSANNRVGINTLLPSTALDVVGDASFSGNVAIGGTLTYEDVTNIDAVGIITARSGIKDETLTAGRVVYTGAAGRLVDNSALTFNPTTLNVPGLNVTGVSTFAGNMTVDAGANTTLDVVADSAGVAMVRTTGASGDQTTAAFELRQSTSSIQGGGISYNGDGSPGFASGETADHVTFYRILNGTRSEVFSYPYNSDNVTFNGTVTAASFSGSLGANNLTGTITGSVQSNITQIGTLGSLTVSGTNNPVNFTHTGQNCVTFNRNSKTLAINANYAGGNAYANIVMTSGMDIRWSLGGADRIVFKSAGHIEPQTDSQINLGADAKRFANVYADTLYGDGSNLTSLPTQVTITGNADNRVITGGSGVNLNGEANLTYNGTTLAVTGTVSATNELRANSHLVMNNADNQIIYLGASNDLQIYHNSASYIKNGSGDLNIQSNVIRLKRNDAGQTFASFINNGQAEFSYSGTTRLSTSPTGITVAGEVAASQDYPNFRPTLDLNFASSTALDPRIAYSRTGPASFVNEFGKVVIIGPDVPRFDHDPITRESKGLLIEESRINYIKYSHGHGFTSQGTISSITEGWGQQNTTNSTLTQFAALGPDGTMSALKYTLNAATGRRFDYEGLSTSNGTVYCYSWWMKRLHSASIWSFQQVGGSGVSSEQIFIDGVAASGQTSAYTPPDDEWHRVTWRFTKTGTETMDIGGYDSSGSTGDRWLLWGAQFEAGSFPTSYIPTNGSTATRGAEITIINGENFTEFYNPVESTILVNHTHLDGITSSDLGTNQRVYKFRAVGGSDTRIDYVSNSNYNPYIASDGSAVASISDGVATVFGGGANKLAVRVKENSFATCQNGTLGLEDTNGAWNPTNAITEVTLGSSNDGNSPVNGHIQRFMYYSTGLPNSQLVTLTS